MATIKNPVILDKTGSKINDTLTRIALGVERLSVDTNDFLYDSAAGEYTNIEEVFKHNADGKTYSVNIPKDRATACVKTDSNAGLTVTPSTATTAGKDDYNAINAFKCYLVNATVDENGVSHVNSIQGKDKRFRNDGSNGNVFVMTPVLYYSMADIDDDNTRLSISDTEAQSLKPQPGAMLPDGSMRGFMLYAAYAGVKDDDGKFASISGRPIWNANISHNTLHTIAMPTGCSGKTIADDWYVKVMMLMKYATKSSQTIFAGCTSYNEMVNITVAETAATRVIVSATDATNFFVNSYVYVNSERKGSMYKILSFDTYDESNVAINIDGTVTTTTELKCITAPYGSGYCDSVLGTDGTVNSPSGKEPFKIQNIECSVGVYEVLADVILEGSPDQKAYVCYDKENYSTSITSNYMHVGTYSGTENTWNYPLYITDANGLLLPQGTGGSSSTGTGDGYYLPSASPSLFEWLGVGHLCDGSRAGLFCVRGDYGLSGAAWGIGSRLSALGRSGVSA